MSEGARAPRISAFDPVKLKTLRDEKGWTTARLAAETGFVYRTIIAWERGNRGPEPANLVDLAEALGVTPGDLLNVPRNQWRLAELRITAGLQLKDVPALTGMSIERCRHIETGTNPLTPEVTTALAKAYKTSEAEVTACWQRARDQLFNPPPPS